jgi:hypothetical protein
MMSINRPVSANPAKASLHLPLGMLLCFNPLGGKSRLKRKSYAECPGCGKLTKTGICKRCQDKKEST